MYEQQLTTRGTAADLDEIIAGNLKAREGQVLKWVRANDLRSYPMPPADIPLIPILRDWL